jgi:hypothetical protein
MKMPRLALFAFALILSPSLPALAGGNGVDRGGGDAYEQEFRTLGHAVADKLLALRQDASKYSILLAPGLVTLDLTAFELTVDTNPVISTLEPVLVEVDGKHVPRTCANSFNQKTIWVNRPMWDELAGQRIVKQSMVFHEYLGLMNLDRDYEISRPYRARLELEADTTQFKIDLTEQLKDLGSALGDYFKNRFDPAFARIETIATTAEYQHCIDKHSKADKPEILANCFGVTAMLIRASKLMPVAADTDQSAQNSKDAMNALTFAFMKEQYHCGWPPPRALLNRLFDSHKKWQIVCPRLDDIIAAFEMPKKLEDPSLQRQMSEKFLTFVQGLPSPARQAYALSFYNHLLDAFNISARDVLSRLQSFHGESNRACPGDLTEAIRCAIPRVLNSVTQELEPTMIVRQRQLNQTVLNDVRALSTYAE